MKDSAPVERMRAVFPAVALDLVDPVDPFAEWGGTYLDAARFRDGIRDRTWEDLPARFLEYHHDAVFFLGPAAFAALLPAYLVAAIERAPELDALPSFLVAALTRTSTEPARFDARAAALSAPQRAAVACALAELESRTSSDTDREPITAALDGYWRTYLEEHS